MRIMDISMSIMPNMQVYKNKAEKRPVFKVIRDFSTGNVYESIVTLDMHTGTHIDAPLHVIENGEAIESIDLKKVITKCKVLDLTSTAEKITETNLSRFKIETGDFVLLKTKNSYMNEFVNDFVYLDESGAHYLKDKLVNGVGIDSLGIERNQPGYPTHKLLLEAGIVVLEGLRLNDVEEAEYTLIALPLKVEGAEACPVRAVLLDLRQG
jgi:arylformamidase